MAEEIEPFQNEYNVRPRDRKPTMLERLAGRRSWRAQDTDEVRRRLDHAHRPRVPRSPSKGGRKHHSPQ